MSGLDASIPTTTAVTQIYISLEKHRGHPGRNRSVWTVSPQTEVACFIKAWQGSWGVNSTELWGHRWSGRRLSPVGINEHREALWFGKFVREPNTLPWHGYPADYRRKPHDRPPVAVLSLWRDLGILAKHQIAKIARGQQCKL